MNVLLGASKMLLTLQSPCPEPSQATSSGNGEEKELFGEHGSCMHSFGEEKNKTWEEAFPWGAPVCKGRVLTSFREGDLF